MTCPSAKTKLADPPCVRPLPGEFRLPRRGRTIYNKTHCLPRKISAIPSGWDGFVARFRRCYRFSRLAGRSERSLMPLDWTPFVELVRRHQRFLLTTHVRPDGDGLGSMLALADVLERHGKAVRMTVASKFPPRYHFLDPERRFTPFTPPGDEFRDT